MEHVRSVVAERCGVTLLRTEVRLLGFGEGKTGAMEATDDGRGGGGAGPGGPS